MSIGEIRKRIEAITVQEHNELIRYIQGFAAYPSLAEDYLQEAYYEALQKAGSGWHEGANDPKPFIRYMLSIILSCYKEFETRVSIAHAAGAKSTSYDIVKAYTSERIGRFSKQEVLMGCPSLGSSSVESALKKLVDDGTLVRIGAGRNTLYARADSIVD